MALPQYNSFSEKDKIYPRHEFVNEIEHLLYIKDEFKPEIRKSRYTGEIFPIRYLFRGINNSSYKIFSSLQRDFDSKLSKGYTGSLLDLSNQIYADFRNNHSLVNELQLQLSAGVEITAPAIWAFIQHFGGPSPLIDFTDSFESALFFAFDRHQPVQQDDPMTEYVSLYVVKDSPMTLGEHTSLFADGAENATKYTQEFRNNNPNTPLEVTEESKKLIEQPLEPEWFGIMVYGGQNSHQAFTVPANPSAQIHTAVENANLLAQSGMFIQGDLKDMRPLEEAFRTHNANCRCFEINKNLLPEIRQIFNIPTTEEVYPDQQNYQWISNIMKSWW